MITHSLTQDFQHISPAGAEVRVLMNNSMGGVAHCTLRNGKTSKAVAHKTVSEIWYILSGAGEIWRKQGDNESITSLTPGITVDIQLGTHFQYRSQGSDLVFICITMPPWSGPDEASYTNNGAWSPNL